ncbi:hypothetical protein PFICI_08076 [Pestalotiopsis fici W106-1]|uniref:TauD/TfdA-like domain-containing protein n=1 Tax=Pestalotiopsis fici (strain W106-1 / CGMCC3.15140) TaxID=1229662 RepID=W3X551_PESFW|nr:uncharacterized protein PFICI_08076 [Pestalotiopsis fici W106-1]ETS80547.1 hypothetical protein PFICI_08076 [Pestalotiopsis fici W106-1]
MAVQAPRLGHIATRSDDESRFPIDSEQTIKRIGTYLAEVDRVVGLIMDILEKFSLVEPGNTEYVGRKVFSPRVRRHVICGHEIPMVLPAFPSKSINFRDKVLGTLPDLGEELALDRLNDLCSQIQKIYRPGAMVLIATDGACYNDLTGVSDSNLWEYGATLRAMVAKKGYHCIKFARFMNLLGLYTEPVMTKETFCRLLQPSRESLMQRYLPPNFDVNVCIREDPDYHDTYNAYARFLKKDLAFGAIRDAMTSGKKYKAKVNQTAKDMITRGVAYAALIREQCPEHVRLSIHPSTGLTKIFIALVPQPGSVSMSPWHCAVAVDVQGRFKTGHKSVWQETHDLVYKSNRPYFFRERSDLYNWEAKVDFDHLYDRKLVIRNMADKPHELSESDKGRLASLIALQAQVTLEGF